MANAIIATLTGPAAGNPAYLEPITALNQMINPVTMSFGLDKPLGAIVSAP